VVEQTPEERRVGCSIHPRGTFVSYFLEWYNGFMNNKGSALVTFIVLAAVFIVGGYVYWSNQNDIISNISDSSGWETYNNEKYGFEIKYPPTFNVFLEEVAEPSEPQKDLPKNISYRSFYLGFRSEVSESFQVTVNENIPPKILTLDDVSRFNVAKDIEGVFRVLEEVSITILGAPAIKIIGEQLSQSEHEETIIFDPPRPREVVYFVRDHQSYIIQITCGVISTDLFPDAKDFCVDNHGENLDKIVSTFKFTGTENFNE
jgi:hypothetical protein